ncbi:hypothetical protein Peur_005503 [Populus x canadensis]
MTSLTSVSLDTNPFESWEIPESLNDATSLKEFSANDANVAGKIPEFFNNDVFPGLESLHLAFNYLEGELPLNFSGSTIRSLWLNGQKSNSRLNGTLYILQNMTSLTEIWLHGNSLTGPLPDLSGMISLKDLSLRDNSLTGVVPPSLVNISTLRAVNFTNNKLQGPTPKFADRVSVDWKKSNSRLNGTLYILQNMTSLTEIWLHGNSLTGPLPDLSGMISLKDLSLRDNSLTGVVPPSLVNISTLRAVNFTNNKLQGPTPKFADRVSVDMNPGTNNFCLDKPGVACDATVDVLLSVAKNFGYPASLADFWKGNDPCSSNTWKGIACVGKDILVINLKKAGLTDVSNNRLYGNIPKFRNNVQVEYAGNPDIGKNGSVYPPPGTPGTAPGSPSGTVGDSDGSGNKNLASGKIVGSVIGFVCGLCMVGLGVFFYNRKQKRSSKVQSPNMMIIHPRHSGDQDAVKITVAGSSANIGAESFTDSVGPSDIHLVRTENMAISIQVLRNVTNNFSEENILGRGGFGTVYKGELHDGTKIAVKRMESGVVSEKGLAEFMSEIAISFHVSCFTTLIHGAVMTCATFGMTGRVTTKVDVLSFGVILMEMITGRKALDETQPEDSLHLGTWFRRMHINKDTFRKAIDPTINLDEETLGSSISTVAELAGHCTAREPYQRPDMGHVVSVLSSLTEIWKAAEPDSAEVLLKWQAFDGSSSSFLPSGDNTQTSIPTKIFG